MEKMINPCYDELVSNVLENFSASLDAHGITGTANDEIFLQGMLLSESVYQLAQANPNINLWVELNR